MILVTGATGKVGRHLVTGLLAEGAAVRALTRSATFLRCGGFAANTLAWAPMIRAEGVVRYLAAYSGRTAQVSPDLEVITRQRATTFTDWAVEHAASFR